MVRTKVSGSVIPVTSETGETSNKAATLGKTDLPKAEAVATM